MLWSCEVDLGRPADPRGPWEVRSDGWGRGSPGAGEENVAPELTAGQDAVPESGLGEQH